MAVSGRYDKGQSIMSLLEQKNPRRTEVQAGKFVQGNRQALESGRWRMHFPSQTQQCRGQWSGLFNKEKLIILLKASTGNCHLYAPNFPFSRDYRAIHTVMPLIVTTCFKQSHHWIFSDVNLPAYLCFFTTINMTNLQKRPKEKTNHYFHPIKNLTPQQKRATCFATLLQSELNSAFLHPRKQTCPATDQVVESCEKVFQKVETSSTLEQNLYMSSVLSCMASTASTCPGLPLTAPHWLHVCCYILNSLQMQLELIKLTLISEVNAGSFLISKLSMGPLSKCKTHGISVAEESFVFMSC